jgi:hypothetical protein
VAPLKFLSAGLIHVAALLSTSGCRVRVLVSPTSRDVFSYSMMVVPGNN